MTPHNITIGILSLGCPKNVVDSEVLLGYLKKDGYAISFDVTQCDVALINTCAFVEDATQESLAMIRELADLKREGRIKYIVVCGCLPQRQKTVGAGYKPAPTDNIPSDAYDCTRDVDAWVGTGEIDRIGTVVRSILESRYAPCALRHATSFLYSHDTPRVFLTPPFAKYIKVSEGCDHTCAFCVIPSLRGSYQSRPVKSIVQEVKDLVAHGLKEAVLIGQDTSYYGKDLDGQFHLAELVAELAQIKNLKWIRCLYLHPNHITKDLIDVFKSNANVCKYIDIPLQHINNDILQSMRRNTSKEKISELIQTLRREIPGVVLRTAFIVGYPGEGYEEFNELLDFMDQMAFERLGAFMYSHEAGSPIAAACTDTVSAEVKKSRFQDLMLLQQKVSRRLNARLKNNVFETLIEGYNEDQPEYLYGRTYMDAPEVDGQVFVKKDPQITIGEFYPVKITDSYEYDLVGTVVKS